MEHKSELKHARKMVLIPYEENHDSKNVDNADIKSTKGLLQDLNIRMNKVLNNRSLPAQQKIFLYNQLHRKYMFIKSVLDKEKNEQVNKLIEVIKKPLQKNLSPMSLKRQTIQKIELPNKAQLTRLHPLTHSMLDTSTIKIDDDDDLDEDLMRSQVMLQSDRDFDNLNDDNDNGNDSENLDNFSTPTATSMHPFPTLDHTVTSVTPSSSHSFPTSRLAQRRNAIDNVQELAHGRKPYYHTRSQLRKIKEEQFDDDDDDDDKKGRRQKGHGIISWSHLK